MQDTYLQQLKDTYTRIDVDFELKKMALWLQTSKGKARKGCSAFIINWLNNSIPTLPEKKTEKTEETPLRPTVNEYLRELWKGREHILELNTKTS